MNQTNHIESNNKGFTLIEIMVALAISGIAITAIYSAYLSQHKSYVVQEQVAAMQQNLRAAIYIMGREIRMAGYNPTEAADAGIQTANANSIQFTADFNGNGNIIGDPGEKITYSLYDAYTDGDNDLGRKVNTGNNNPVAENIDALNFVYLAGNNTETTVLSEIRSVQVSVVARTERSDPDFVNTTTYSNQQGTVILAAQNDNYRRRLLIAQIKCRNLGLKK